MPITAADVRGTTFKTTRLRRGYGMDEVDAFLDIIEADVAQYADDLQRSRDGEAVLRTQCDQLQMRLTLAERQLADASTELAQRRAAAGTVGVETQVLAPVPAAPEPEPEITPPAEVLEQAADDPEAMSILAIAQTTADEMIRNAEARAGRIKAEVRTMLTNQLSLVDRTD